MFGSGVVDDEEATLPGESQFVADVVAGLPAGAEFRPVERACGGSLREVVADGYGDEFGEVGFPGAVPFPVGSP